MALSIHSQAPDFSLASTGSRLAKLDADFSNKACILLFYLRDFNTDCTKEVCAFRDSFKFLKRQGIEVLGISRDDIASHLTFKNKYDLPFELLSDSKGEVSEQYQAFYPLIRFRKRITYLLNKQHNIANVYENLFEPKKHVQHMINIIQQG